MLVLLGRHSRVSAFEPLVGGGDVVAVDVFQRLDGVSLRASEDYELGDGDGETKRFLSLIHI